MNIIVDGKQGQETPQKFRGRSVQRSGLFGGGFMRNIDRIDPEGCMQFEKVQRRAKTIGCLRRGIVWEYKLRVRPGFKSQLYRVLAV